LHLLIGKFHAVLDLAGLYLKAFQRKQPRFRMQTSTITCEIAIAAYYTMAGNYNRYWISAVRSSNCAHG